MAVYVVVTVDVTNEAALAALTAYRDPAPEIAAEYGGQILGRGDMAAVSGAVMPLHRRRIIMYEFESMAQAMHWHLLPNATPEHEEFRRLRQQAGAVSVTFIDGNR